MSPMPQTSNLTMTERARVICLKHAKTKRAQTSISMLLATIAQCAEKDANVDSTIRKMISNKFVGDSANEMAVYNCTKTILSLLNKLGVMGSQKELSYDFGMSIRNMFTHENDLLENQRKELWVNEIFTLKFQLKDIPLNSHSIGPAVLTLLEQEILDCLQIFEQVELYAKLDEARMNQQTPPFTQLRGVPAGGYNITG